uniref:Uncharacterized protein n=1 Tax=Marseillevirus LCMAC101 TaxID=2506602 RepID=A0A481YT95_9VIRU|nr:MAG: hypothetical protein LCMAC101_03110 [Marseillevirus LCMAC101]
MNNTIWVLIIIGVVLLLLLCPKKEGFKPGGYITPGKKNISVFPEVNTNIWPQYNYSFPYNYKYAGAWAPAMYSRLRYRSPGFYSGTALSVSLRPGIGNKYWSRDHWIRNTQFGDKRYFNVTNADDYIHDQSNYDGLPQLFQQ